MCLSCFVRAAPIYIYIVNYLYRRTTWWCAIWPERGVDLYLSPRGLIGFWGLAPLSPLVPSEIFSPSPPSKNVCHLRSMLRSYYIQLARVSEISGTIAGE